MPKFELLERSGFFLPGTIAVVDDDRAEGLRRNPRYKEIKAGRRKKADDPPVPEEDPKEKLARISQPSGLHSGS